MNWTAAVIFVLIAFGLAAWDFPAVDPHQSALTYVFAGVLTTAVYLASLLAHELAHSLVARRYGVTVKSITLWLLGGISELGGEAPGPAAEAWIVGAGPWFSLIGWFLAGSATAEAQQAVLTGRLRGIQVGQIMTPDPVTAPGSMTVSEFIDDYMFRARHQGFPVTGDDGDTVTGLVTLDRIRHVPASQRDRTRLAERSSVRSLTSPRPHQTTRWPTSCPASPSAQASVRWCSVMGTWPGSSRPATSPG